MKKKDIVQKLNENKDHYENWINKLNTAEKSLSNVKRSLDQTTWFIGAIEKMPDDFEPESYEDFYKTVEFENESKKSHLPMIPTVDYGRLSSVTTVSASGIFQMQDICNGYLQFDPVNHAPIIKDIQESYSELISEESQIHDVEIYLYKIDESSLIDRFSSAKEQYLRSLSLNNEFIESTIIMRNFVDGIKGCLFSAAKNSSKENMTWQKMSLRLSGSNEDCIE